MIFNRRFVMIALAAVMASGGLSELQDHQRPIGVALLVLAALICWSALRSRVSR
jgi:hypothetical protein